jgi:ergothioneine biosynthesis protein EgtC
MCRFVMYLGEPLSLASLVTLPTNSLIHQSRESEVSTIMNADGFGVAWYGDGVDVPAVFRSITPAWSNRNLLSLARVARSHCVLAHVRSATQGMAIHEGNTHPFTHGRYSFMHNGSIAQFSRIRRGILDRLSDETFHVLEGTTDSEHVFGLFLDALRPLEGLAPAEAMGRALEVAVGQVLDLLDENAVTEPTSLNLAVADGSSVAALRFSTGPPQDAPTLYYHEGRRYVCEDGVCRMIDADARADTVIIASECLSEDDGWELIGHNSLLLVTEDRRPQLRPFAPKPRARARAVSA